MGYFDTVPYQYFSLFSGNDRNIYFDVIRALYKVKDRSVSIYKSEAKVIIRNILDGNAEYITKNGSVMDSKGIDILANNILRGLVDHFWLKEKMSTTESEDMLIFSKQAIDLYLAMEKMAAPMGEHEYTNDVADVCNVCQKYLDGEYREDDYYLRVLKSVTDSTNQLREDLNQATTELEEIITQTSKQKTEKELVEYIRKILSGKELKNYFRLIDGKNEFSEQRRTIMAAMERLKYDDFAGVLAAYQLEVGESGVEAADRIDQMISDNMDFYGEECEEIFGILHRTISNYLKKAQMRYDMFLSSRNGSRVSSVFLAYLARDMKKNGDGPCDDRMMKWANLYDVRILSDESLYKRKMTKAADAEEDEEEEEYGFDVSSALDAINSEAKRDSKQTQKYIEETFGDSKVIRAEEFRVDSSDSYRLLIDVLYYATGQDFPYYADLDYENTVNYGKAACQSFRLVRKENR